MSLDSKQKRGSAVDVSSPWRQWLANPSADVDYAERVSILRFCSAVPEVTGVPEVPGIEYVWTGDRLHYRWKGSRLHYVWSGNRLHYRGDEEL